MPKRISFISLLCALFFSSSQAEDRRTDTSRLVIMTLNAEFLWDGVEYNNDGTREEVVEKFRRWFLAQPELVQRAKSELKGKVLGCWCKPDFCHGDVIAEIMNME